jgi:methylornithine synthase
MISETSSLHLDKILLKAYEETPLTQGEIKYLLSLTRRPEEILQIFETARSLRDKYFHHKVFLYGFVYFSTYCRNDCAFCLYRRSNYFIERYRKSESEILDTAYRLIESGVHLLDLTMGEDPEYFSQNCRGFERLLRTVETLRKETGAPLMISPGVISADILAEFKNIGVDWYACYQETHNRELFEKLRLGQDYDERMDSKKSAHKMGLLIEEGLLAGVGDTTDDIVHSLGEMKKLRANQIRVMTFVPQKQTPMYDWPSISRVRELLIIAVMRLVFPDKLIPASLDVDGLSGLKQRLDAGANVVTSIIPPYSGLAGVSRSTLDIEEGNRAVHSILPVLEGAGLVAADSEDYTKWVMDRQKNNLN